MKDKIEAAAAEWAIKQRKEYTVLQDWMCLVPRPDAINENTTLLSDHETKSICACEFQGAANYAFRAGAQWQAEQAQVELAERDQIIKDLVRTLKSIQDYVDDAPEIAHPADCAALARRALKKHKSFLEEK